MGVKRILNLYVDDNVIRRAKELGINMSRICETALLEMISKREGEEKGVIKRVEID